MAKAPSLSMAQRLLLASQSMAPVAVKAALVQKLGPEQAAQLSPHMVPAQLRELILELQRLQVRANVTRGLYVPASPAEVVAMSQLARGRRTRS